MRDASASSFYSIFGRQSILETKSLKVTNFAAELKISYPMKSKFISSSLIAICALLVWSCNPAGSTAGSGDKVALEVKLEKGLIYKQLNKTEQTSEQSIMGMSTKTSQTTEMYIKNEVLDVDAEGTATIKATYERMKMEMDNSMSGKMSFDSDKMEGEVPMQYKGYMALVGRSIGFKIDKHGTVQEVSGVDSLFDSILASVGGNEGGPEMSAMKTALKASFGDDAIKSMMQSASIMYPDVLIAEGDTWGKKVSSVGAMPLAIDITYKVDNIDDEKIVLSFEGKISTDKGKALDLGIVEMTMDLSGDYKGTSEIDRKTGLVLKSSIVQDMKGEMGAMGMKIPMSVDQKITIERY